MGLIEIDRIVCRSSVYIRISVIELLRKNTTKTVKLILPRGKVILKFRGGTRATVTSQTGRGTFR